MSNILHLVAKGGDLANLKGTIGLLCEFASDSRVISHADQCFGPEVLLGSADAALAEVYPLVSKLLRDSPRTEGFQPLRVFEETLLEQFSYIAQAVNLDRWISEKRFSQCRFVSYSAWLDRLRAARVVTHSGYEIVAKVPVLESSGHGRALQRLSRSRPSLADFSRRVAPLWARRLSGIPRKIARENIARGMGRGGIWFYSTAYNYSKTGLEYEPFLPQKMNYLIEDPATGGKRLKEAGREWHYLYTWSRASDIPSRTEILALGDAITAAISNVPLSERESILRAVFLKSEWWKLFLTRRLPFVIFQSRVLQRWYESVAPEMILVGNAAFERVLLLHENVRQVPVIMLQHGIMHWTYGVTDEPVDVFLLRGPFFQRVINERLRRKTVILNLSEPKKTAVAERVGAKRDKILFITTPYNVPELFHEEDRRDILRSLLRAAHSTGRGLLIRVHPMEKISAYEKTVDELQRDLGGQANVSYSQGPGAEDVLARACVAVLYFSTMFLDCLRHGIPIVSFGWHWFLNKRHFEEECVFNFARDLGQLEALLKQGVEGSLPFRSSGLDQFLAATRPEEISHCFRKIWESRKLLKGGVHPVAVSEHI